MKTLILGMGNSILSDDSVGIRVAHELRGKVDPSSVTIEEASVGGLNMLDLIVGFDKAIIIDAIQTTDGHVGQIYRLTDDFFNSTRYATSAHDVNFATAIELGKKLGLAIPKEIIVFAIEVKEIITFSETCTPEVEAAIPVAVNKVLGELQNKNS